MHLLQVCNVGEIMGGTAACAWSLCRALPEWTHTIAFLSKIRPRSREAFHPHSVIEWNADNVASTSALAGDLIVLHNISPGRFCLPEAVPTIQYVHSTGRRMLADETVYCSQWLADQCGGSQDQVVWQGVPIPPSRPEQRTRGSNVLRVGRICTPTRRKWPESLISFYSELAIRHPEVQWEFVGCPVDLSPALRNACQQRAIFLPASWESRALLREWDAMLYHHPTLTESFGRTIAEAARAGCIPIVDERGGFQEQLRAIGGFGCRSINDFSMALTNIADVSMRSALSTSIHLRAEECFSLRAFRDRILKLFQRHIRINGHIGR